MYEVEKKTILSSRQTSVKSEDKSAVSTIKCSVSLIAGSHSVVCFKRLLLLIQLSFYMTAIHCATVINPGTNSNDNDIRLVAAKVQLATAEEALKASTSEDKKNLEEEVEKAKKVVEDLERKLNSSTMNLPDLEKAIDKNVEAVTKRKEEIAKIEENMEKSTDKAADEKKKGEKQEELNKVLKDLESQAPLVKEHIKKNGDREKSINDEVATLEKDTDKKESNKEKIAKLKEELIEISKEKKSAEAALQKINDTIKVKEKESKPDIHAITAENYKKYASGLDADAKTLDEKLAELTKNIKDEKGPELLRTLIDMAQKLIGNVSAPIDSIKNRSKKLKDRLAQKEENKKNDPNGKHDEGIKELTEKISKETVINNEYFTYAIKIFKEKIVPAAGAILKNAKTINSAVKGDKNSDESKKTSAAEDEKKAGELVKSVNLKQMEIEAVSKVVSPEAFKDGFFSRIGTEIKEHPIRYSFILLLVIGGGAGTIYGCIGIHRQYYTD